NVTKNESPSVPCSIPPLACQAARRSARWRSRTWPYRSVPSACSSWVERSISLNRKVAVPPAAASGSVIRAWSSSVVGGFGQLAQPRCEPAQDREGDAWFLEQDGFEVPRCERQARRRPDGDHLG